MIVYYWPNGEWLLHEPVVIPPTWQVGTITLPDENHYEDWQIDMMVKERLDENK